MLEQESLEELAHELYTAAQLAPGEGIEDAVGRLVALMDTQQPSPTPQADSQPAPVRDYPPLPDFETVEQHIYGACRRYITQDMLEPIHNLIRDVIDADRASRSPTSSVLEDADPLQGAANWLVKAHSGLGTRMLARKLSIGYNRAKRLHDAAIAARKHGSA